MKVCSKCKINKPLTDFNKNCTKATNLSSECRECQHKSFKKYHLNNKNKIKSNKLQKIYGITLEEYNSLLEKQNNVCAICHNQEIVSGRSLAVDHNHSTNQIRGLLCGNCNHALGKVKDSIELLKRMIEYLNEFSSKAD